MVTGYDMAKLPKKFKYPLYILLACAFCYGLFCFLYVNAGPHLFPDFFAIDNEQRVYLSYNSGVYVVDDNRFYPVFKGTIQSPVITISNDDVLYIADTGDYTAVDLISSLPKEGIIQSETVSFDDVRSFFDQSRIARYETDEQGGSNYRYEKSVFQYKIICETASGDELVFRMQESEFILNVIMSIWLVLLLACAALSALLVYRYAQTHPEISTVISLFGKKSQDSPSNRD